MTLLRDDVDLQLSENGDREDKVEFQKYLGYTVRICSSIGCGMSAKITIRFLFNPTLNQTYLPSEVRTMN